jgi:hypothetical protein
MSGRTFVSHLCKQAQALWNLHAPSHPWERIRVWIVDRKQRKRHSTGYCRQAVASRQLRAPCIRDTPPSGGQQSSLVWQVEWKPESGGGNWELYAAKPWSGRGCAIYTALSFMCLKIQQRRDSSVDYVIRTGPNNTHAECFGGSSNLLHNVDRPESETLIFIHCSSKQYFKIHFLQQRNYSVSMTTTNGLMLFGEVIIV